MIPFEDFLVLTLEPPKDDGSDTLERFEQTGYESYFMAMNMDALFVILILTFTIPLILFILLSLCTDRSKFAKQKRSDLAKSMHGNLIIRYLMEACLDIAICFGIEYRYGLDGQVDLESSTLFYTVNTIVKVLLVSAVVIFPVLAIVLYLRKFDKWQDEAFEERYGATLEGLRKDKKGSIFYPFLFMIRRLLFAVVAIVTIEHLFVQTITLVTLSIIMVGYLSEIQPFDEPKMYRLEVMNELTTLTMIYIMIGLSEANPHVNAIKLWLDIAFIAVIGINISVHLSLLVANSIFTLKQTIKTKCCK